LCDRTPGFTCRTGNSSRAFGPLFRMSPFLPPQLKKAQRLLNAGKRKQAVERLRKIISRYSRTKAAINAMIILEFMPQ
jgi:hypothetical protein